MKHRLWRTMGRPGAGVRVLLACTLFAGGLVSGARAQEAGEDAGADVGTGPDAGEEGVRDAQRARFVAAREALAAGDRTGFREAIPGLAGYPLQAWLVHEDLVDRWTAGEREPGAAALEALQGFADDFDDSSLTRRVARALQKRYAADERWPAYLELEASRFGTSMPCTTLRARAETGALDGFDEASTALWIEPESHGEGCDALLERLAGDGPPSLVALWERVYAAIDANEFDAARDVLKWLGSTDRRAVDAWVDAARTSSTARERLSGDALVADTPLNRREIADLVMRWSKDDTAAAIGWWLANSDRWTFFRDRYYDTHRALLMRAAYRRMPEAMAWLDTLEARPDDLELMEWRVRTALLAGNWPQVRYAISRLPAAEREEDHWAYWEARALEMDGRSLEAATIYRRLAELQSWHGFLSADRAGLDYAIRDEPIDAPPALVRALAARPRLVRAHEYGLVGLASEGRREWANEFGEERDSTLLEAGAVLAKGWGLDDRAIFNAGRADARRALSYRFPVLYRDDVAAASAAHGVAPAWILGVMRRESAFIPDVVSSAGAVGLMQLMPATADYIAGLRSLDEGDNDLTDGAFNIDFGAFYLGRVAERFDGNVALATASYNAGPTRVTRWLPERDMEADRWIDTIPYSETRRYVRAVLAYAAIYEQELDGKPLRLVDKLVPVPGTVSGTVDEDGGASANGS